MREKLIELLERAFESFIDDPYCMPDEREFADHLIANGVVIQQDCQACAKATNEVIANLQKRIATDNRVEYPCIHFDCGKCKKFSNEIVTSWCVEGPCKYQQPSNADRIRAMSDEELAEDYCKTLLEVMQYFGIKNTGIFEDAVRARLEWLKQPAEGE